jgi:hypothetical protein
LPASPYMYSASLVFSISPALFALLRFFLGLLALHCTHYLYVALLAFLYLPFSASPPLLISACPPQFALICSPSSACIVFPATPKL